MVLKIKRPANLPTGPVWFVPDIGDNRDDLENAFRVKGRPLNARLQAKINADLLSSGHLDLFETGLEVIRRQVIEVENIEIDNILTGETLKPTNGKQLADALKLTDWIQANRIMQSLQTAFTTASVLEAGELGNLKRQREFDLASGEALKSGLAPAAETSTTTPSVLPATDGDESADAMNPLHGVPLL